MKVRARLLLWGAALPSVAMIAAVLLAGQAFRFLLVRSLDRALLAHAAVESVSMFDGPEGRPHLHMGKSPLAGEVRSFAPVSGLFDASGVLVAHYPEGANPPPLHSRERPLEPRIVTHVENDGTAMRELFVGVSSPDGTPYLLQVGSSLAEIRSTTRTFYAVTLSFCVAFALGLGAVQARQAGRMSRRVTEMAEALPRIREGDLEWHLPRDPTGDEIADLRVALSESMDRLRAARDAQERLIANAAHELRTPLGVMRTELDLALRRERSAEELRRALEEARGEVDRLAALAARLLDLASFGRVTFSLAEGDVAEVAREAAAGCEVPAAEGEVRVHVTAPGSVVGRFDRAALRQALDNLLSNAIRFAPPRSSVEVAVARREDRVLLTVRDEGPGVPEDEAQKIFEPFYRRDRHGGAGLGLAIVAEIARRHGGRAYLEKGNGETKAERGERAEKGEKAEKGAAFVIEIAA
jgi:signal transduction histidine kinase